MSPFYLSWLIFCVLLFQILSVIYLYSLPYIFLLCVIFSAISFSSLCYLFCHFISSLRYPFCHISFFITFSSFCHIPFSINYVLSFLPCSLFSMLSVISILPDSFFLHYFLFFPQYLLFLFRRFVLFSNVCHFSFRSLYSSLNFFCLFLTRRKITVMSYLNEIAMDHLGNGVEGGRRYSACPQPFLSRIWTENIKKNDVNGFSSISDICLVTQPQLYEHHLCSSLHTYMLFHKE